MYNKSLGLDLVGAPKNFVNIVWRGFGSCEMQLN